MKTLHSRMAFLSYTYFHIRRKDCVNTQYSPESCTSYDYICGVIYFFISLYEMTNNRNIILDGTLNRQLPAVLSEVANDVNAQLLTPITISKVMAVQLNELVSRVKF